MELPDFDSEAFLPLSEPVLSVSEAAASGDRRKLLVAMRAVVARAVESPETPPRDLAALSLRLIGITEAIEAIDVARAEDDVAAAANTPDEPWDDSAI